MRFVSVVFLIGASTSALADAGNADAQLSTGKEVYAQTCVACHGTNGKGALPSVNDLTKVNGALAKSDAELLASITEGTQSTGSPLAMPAKGGNPALSEADIKAVIAYLRATFGS